VAAGVEAVGCMETQLTEYRVESEKGGMMIVEGMKDTMKMITRFY
jgi:hypothetical protein